MNNIRKNTKELRDIKSKNSIMINPNTLADILIDLIKIKSNKNYITCYGKNFIYLLDEKNLNNMYYIHTVDDVIDYDGILIYKNRVNVCNTGDFGYIREFIKYIVEFINSMEYLDINQMLDDFVNESNNSIKSRIRKI